MLPNEKFALECRAYYDEMGLIVDKTNGEFAHCPYPKGMGEAGYYLLWEHHQQQGILQSKDVGECCFFIGHARKWLVECDPFPDNYFELWDIYEKYAATHARKSAHKSHEIKDELGRSVLGMENVRRMIAITHAKKDEFGRSLHGLSRAQALHAEKDELGRSLVALKASKTLHAKKDELGRSLVALKAFCQVWESTEDGFRSNAGNVAQHNRRNGWDPNARRRIS